MCMHLQKRVHKKVATFMCVRERERGEVSTQYLDADEAVHLELPVDDVVVVGHGSHHPRHQRHLRTRLPYLQESMHYFSLLPFTFVQRESKFRDQCH